MSKSLGNAIYLSDAADVVVKKVMSMYTDEKHLRVEDPGNIEGNTVFAYLDIFDPEHSKVEELKLHYQKGGLGDVVLKKRLIEVLNTFLEPIRIKRLEYAKDIDQIVNIAVEGSAKVREIAASTMQEVRQAIKLIY
jgi:tryptophanyl-tRNA synthetase